MNYVSSNKTCRKCGICSIICPVNAIHLSTDSFWVIDEKICTNCGLCKSVCSAIEVNRDKLLEKDLSLVVKDGVLGPVASTRVGRIPDVEKNDLVASGGAVTAILTSLFKSGEIDTAVGVGMDPNNPTRTKTIVIKNVDDIKNISGSFYQLTPHCSIIPDLKNIGKKIAYIGLPCHVQTLKKYEALGNKTNVVITLGLFCGFNLLPKACDFLISKLKRGNEKPIKVEFRGGKWPGGFKVTWDSNEISYVEKDKYSLIDLLYLPECCKYCVDLANELSDLSFGDAWYMNEPYTTILDRTYKGNKALENASLQNEIEVKEVDINEVIKTQSHTIKHKKYNSYMRLCSLPEDIRPSFLGYNIKKVKKSYEILKFKEFCINLSAKIFEVLPFKVFTFMSKWLFYIYKKIQRKI